jgi:hypothetical protein
MSLLSDINSVNPIAWFNSKIYELINGQTLEQQFDSSPFYSLDDKTGEIKSTVLGNAGGLILLGIGAFVLWKVLEK